MRINMFQKFERSERYNKTQWILSTFIKALLYPVPGTGNMNKS